MVEERLGRGVLLRRLVSSVVDVRGAIPLHLVAWIGAEVAAQLHELHERRGPDKRALGTVYRDVSPSNILLGYDSSVTVVDTGRVDSNIAYRSPEQCRNAAIDRRSDVYSLGVVLYELATVTRLFRGDTDHAVIEQIVNGKIALPRIRRPEVPNELSMIIMKALATDPARRYQTAGDLGLALQQFATAVATSTSLADFLVKQVGEPSELPVETSTVDESPFHDSSSGRASRSTGVPLKMISSVGLPIVQARETSPRLIDPTLTPRAPSIASRPPAPATGWTGARIAMIATPLVAIIGFLVWRLVATTPAQVVPAASTAAMVVPSPAITSAAPAVAQPEPSSAPVESHDMTVLRHKEPPKPAPAGKPKAVEAPSVTPDEPSAPVVAEPAPVADSPVIAPSPATPIPVAQLSSATVSSVAHDHDADLAKCRDGGDDLHGQVTVQFEIDASGRVAKTQVASTVGKPAINGCLLRTLQRWQFPRPPTGSAQGTYALVFQ